MCAQAYPMPESQNGESEKSVLRIASAIDKSMARALSKQRGTPPPHGLQVRGTQINTSRQGHSVRFEFKGQNAEFIARFVHDICSHDMGRKELDPLIRASKRFIFKDGAPTDRYFNISGDTNDMNQRLATVAEALENDKNVQELLDEKLAFYRKMEEELDCKIFLAFETGLEPMRLRIKNIYCEETNSLAKFMKHEPHTRVGFEEKPVKNGEWDTSDRTKRQNGISFRITTIEASDMLEEFAKQKMTKGLNPKYCSPELPPGQEDGPA